MFTWNDLSGITGTYISNIVPITLSDRLKSSKITWSSETNQSMSVKVYTSISLDNGSTFDTWQLTTKNEPIPNFNIYDDLTTAKIQFKIIFASVDTINIPKLFDITLEVNSAQIHLFENSSVEYTETISEKFTGTYFIKLPSDFSGVFMELGDSEYQIGYENSRFYYKRGYRYVAGQSRVLPTVDFKVGIKGDTVIVITDDYTEILK